MYAFILDHEQGKVLRHELPASLQKVSTDFQENHDDRLKWLETMYDLTTVDVMFTDCKKVIKIGYDPYVPPPKQVVVHKGRTSWMSKTPVPQEVIYKGQKLFMSGPPKDSRPARDG